MHFAQSIVCLHLSSGRTSGDLGGRRAHLPGLTWNVSIRAACANQRAGGQFARPLEAKLVERLAKVATIFHFCFIISALFVSFNTSRAAIHWRCHELAP